MYLVLATFPPILIAYFVYKQDKYEKEPLSLISLSFFLGCLSVIPAIVFELVYNQSLFPNLFLYVLFGIAFIEEGVKFFFLRKYIYRNKNLDEPMDGIVYAVMVGLGFALVENIMYVLENPEQSFDIAVLRMFTAIPLHAICGVILGYYIGLAKFSKNPFKLMCIGLLFATIIHCMYNYFIFIDKLFLSIIIIVIGTYFSLKAINIHKNDSKIRN
tara:strand:- start:353 stop:997 length:645 start_codon:yes stop_codon:yes gene_type:complete